MLQSLLPTDNLNNWNIPAWSVSAEAVFYLVFPFFVWLVVSAFRGRWLVRVAAGLWAVQIALFVALAVVVERLGERSGKTPYDIELELSRMKFFPGLRVWEFFIGCLLGAAFLRARSGAEGPAFLRPLERKKVRDACLYVVVAALAALGAAAGRHRHAGARPPRPADEARSVPRLHADRGPPRRRRGVGTDDGEPGPGASLGTSPGR